MISLLRKLRAMLAQRYVVLHAHSELESRFALEARRFFELTCCYNASVDPDEDMQKMQYTLLRENHIIEKGLSLKCPRKGFGQEKVLALIGRLEKYVKRYGGVDARFLHYPLDTIRKYIDYTKSCCVSIPRIENAFEHLCKMAGYCPNAVAAGVMDVSRDGIKTAAGGNFEQVLASRHSIRYFDKMNLPTRAQIDAALRLAQRTPSACNRQAWHTHVFRGEQSVDLIRWQGGSRGFEDEMTTSILVTSDLKGFLQHEVHQAYVDGGLYAMNLINAIHALGMGAIPLSTGFEFQQLKGLDKFGIPENEVPILIVGVGNLLPEFKVAVSSRKDLSLTNVYHCNMV